MTIIKRIWDFIASIFKGLDAQTKIVVPVAISIVEGVKKVMDTPVDDILLTILKGAIPGEADDILIDKISETVTNWLPKIILELKMVEAVANIEDQNAQLQAILDKLSIGSDEALKCFYHDLGSLIIEKLSDGKLSWSDSVCISEFWFKRAIQKSI